MDSARFGADYLDRISEHLYSSVLADILDEAGYRQQVMRPEVRPLYPGAKVAGRAATMLAVEVSELPAQPYQLLMEILDGLSRDSWGIEEMKFPVFATGLSPADSKGRLEVISIRGTIPVGGVSVADGDLIVADSDGCVVVPAAIEDAIVAKAVEKVSGEDKMRDVLRKGASIREVFKEYGIL